MKTKDIRLGRTLNGKARETTRQAALAARRREQSFCRFLESMNGELKFGNSRMLRYPIG